MANVGHTLHPAQSRVAMSPLVRFLKGEPKAFGWRSKAISGVLLVFTVLQFIISICVSAYGCYATCCTEPGVPAFTYANQVAAGNPQVPIVTYPKQATPGNPQHVMYLPQATMNTNNFVQPNMYERPAR